MAEVVKGTRKCGDERPEKKGDEQKVTRKGPTFKELGDLPIAITIFPGCIEGDRVTYTVKGDERKIILNGTAQEIAFYSIGEKVEVKDGKTAVAPYQRNVGRKQEEGVKRIRDEMKGTGGIAELARTKQGRYAGYTISVNGTKITPDSRINSFLERKVLMDNNNKPRLQEGKEVKYWGGIEMVVSAVITPGNQSRIQVLGQYIK